MLIDPHTHSSISDGTDSPSQLVANAARAGLAVVGLCDHDTTAGWAGALAAAASTDVRVLRGIEISCEVDHVSVHLLAYGCRESDVALQAELSRVRAGRTERVPTMLARLAEHGMPIPDAVLQRYVGDSPSVGRPHFADAMIELGYVVDRQEAFSDWLAEEKPGYVPRYSAALEVAIDLVHAAGGAAVIAHPWARASRPVLSEDFLKTLVESERLDGIEVDHQDHDAATREELRALAVRVGTLVTGSSDYHGTGKKDHELGCNTTVPPVLEELDRRVRARGGLL